MQKIRGKSFHPFVHFPAYSWVLLKSVFDPLLIYLAFVGNGVLFLCALLFMYIESAGNPSVNNFFDALWWAITTVTTVGYGDVVPLTTKGKVLGMALMLLGVVMFVASTAILASNIFTHLRAAKRKYLDEVQDELSILERRLDAIEGKIDQLSKER